MSSTPTRSKATTDPERARILIVHDDPAVAYALSDLMRARGYAAEVVANIQIAGHVTELYPPDLVIVDVRLPRQSAIEFCAQLKCDERTRLIPVVMVSAAYDAAERLQCVEAGADEYICALHTLEDLEARVRLLLWHKQRNDQLELADAVIDALLRALAAADPATGEHARRLADLALMVGRRLGLSDPALAVLRQGALLHDIGKLGVDPAIVRKDGPLTEVEYAQIQQHALIGERIVRPLRLAAAVAPIVRHHHERWDGRGYPDGLHGAATPLGARIVAAVDAFDAMTAPHPYTLAYTHTTAIERLRAEAGFQWDPAVVDALAGCLFELMEDTVSELVEIPELERAVGGN